MERLHPEASVATPIEAAETRMGAVEVWNTKRPASRRMMVAFMMRERRNSWARQRNRMRKVWLRKGRELRLWVRLLVVVGIQMWISGSWRVDGRRWWRWWRKGWRMDLKTGVDTAIKTARGRVGAI